MAGQAAAMPVAGAAAAVGVAAVGLVGALHDPGIGGEMRVSGILRPFV